MKRWCGGLVLGAPIEITKWFHTSEIPSGLSLVVYTNQGDLIFSSDKKWLHPLLELEKFISTESLDPSTLLLHDRIAGRAAAALTIRMGFTTVKVDLLSSLAIELFERYNLEYRGVTVVDSIECQTETLVKDVVDIETIYTLIQKRVGQIK